MVTKYCFYSSNNYCYDVLIRRNLAQLIHFTTFLVTSTFYTYFLFYFLFKLYLTLTWVT